MAPPPEYDKEPKAPDKSATTVTSEEIKVHNLVNDLPTFSDHKTANSASNNEIENNKHVESLDDGQLRALLDEAIQYKCPKDREGKSSLFKELLEEVEHQDEVSEAASRGFIARGGPHANSLQDLMAALKVESTSRPVRHQPPPHSQTSVSARAIHGGSLPSGVDTSFLLAEEPTRGGYLATVRCVNPPPLAERRVSASDANTPAEMELLNKSKPMFPMYTARASLEIGSGSVCSGRAVTTTTPSNQVRKTTPPHPASHQKRFHHNRTLNHHQVEPRPIYWSTTRGPPERIYTPKSLYQPDKLTTKQDMLLYALRPKCADCAKYSDFDEGSIKLCGSDNLRIAKVDEDIQKTPEVFANAVENWYKDLRPEFAEVGKEDAKGSVIDVSGIEPRGPDHTNTIKATIFHRKPLVNSGVSANTVVMHNAKSAKHPDSNTNTEKHKVRELNTKLTVGAKIDIVPFIRSNSAAGDKEESDYSKSNKHVRNPKPSGPSGVKNIGKGPQNRAKRACVKKEKKICIENSNDGVEKSRLRDCVDANTDRRPKDHRTGYSQETDKYIGIYCNTVDNWYKGLTMYSTPRNINTNFISNFNQVKPNEENKEIKNPDINPNIDIKHIAECHDIYNPFAPKFETNVSVEENTLSASSNVRNKSTQDDTCDIREYRKRVGKIVRASMSSVNPRNVRSLTIGKPEPIDIDQDINKPNKFQNSNHSDTNEIRVEIKPKSILKVSSIRESKKNKLHYGKKQLRFELETKTLVRHEEKSDTQNYDNDRQEMKEMEVKNISESHGKKELYFEHALQNHSEDNQFEMKNMSKHQSVESDIEMTLISNPPNKGQDTFSEFLAYQQNLLKSLESANYTNCDDDVPMARDTNNNDDASHTTDSGESTKKIFENFEIDRVEDNSNSERVKLNDSITTTNTVSPSLQVSEYLELTTETNTAVTQICRLEDPKPGEHYVLAELSNNAYVFLTFPKRLAPPQDQTVQQEIENIVTPNVSSALVQRKNSEAREGTKKEINKNSLRVLLLESLLRREGAHRGPAPAASAETQVDSTIPFSCITTPEVVASCNTTSSTAQSAVAVDPKPLQLDSCYRAVVSLTGAPPAPSAPPAPRTPSDTRREQPRSVMSSTFNGLPLSRPNYGATASAAADEYKKSLDENGNAVQGISSPISGSSQHKKPRRKKSSKNETVIKSHQIDGYQGNKDLNEVLRFIESNADAGRQGKLRGKHKDDDDKGKKRSAERRKDKEKVKRASSLEELSRTKLEDLTDAPEPPPAKPERRSWGDDARDGFYFRAPEPEPAPAPDADFQTVTKRRKPRRRDTERDERAERDARRARLPEPRARRESAPPSDRSNDSNDDMDSVHSLPAPARAPLVPPAPAPHASYADIARTRHNIPDLIESCNFYAEGEGGGDARRAEPAPAPIDADGYPALEPRAVVVRRGTAKPPPPCTLAPRRDRKERAPPAPPDCPAPDVVADRRPPVILLDSAARPRDMDGVTFGFDINEQLLGGPARRPRCDLVRDAPDADAAAPSPEAAPGAARAGAAPAAVAVLAGCAALRYVPPDPPPDTHHLHQIIDYVGAAWEDVMRCGAGKVRYFSE